MDKSFDQSTAIKQLLTALEYGTRKEEFRITNKLIQKHKLERISKNRLCLAILDGPGFEPFFLDVVSELRPFAFMVQEIYRFLSSYKTTAERGASIFRVSEAKAHCTFDFNLDYFPKELFHVIVEVTHLYSTMKLQYGMDAADSSESLTWDKSDTEALWDAVSPRWDGDFYDDGFHRVLSYAGTVLGKASKQDHQRAKDIVEPITDRLKALTAPLNWDELHVKQYLLDSRIMSYMNGQAEGLEWEQFPPERHTLDREQAIAYFKTPIQSGYRSQENIWDTVAGLLIDMSISLTIWEHKSVRKDRDDWLANRLGQPFNMISSGDYLQLLESLAKTYLTSLDRLAPVVDERSVASVYEDVVEFLRLPFWKDRWFLYELWTLCFTLSIAKEKWPVKLFGIENLTDKLLEWKLPDATAKAPVAKIGVKGEVECWIQRKTYHPETRKGLEPDLRMTKATSGHHDLFIVENKDRRKPRKSKMSEILYRYATGTYAKCICLVNYEEFTKPTHDLGQALVDRRILVFSNFKPSTVPEGFRTSILQVLGKELGPVSETSDEAILEPRKLASKILKTQSGFIKTILTWTQGPSDMDLHAWVTRMDKKSHHIYYADHGYIDHEPFAELDKDDRSPPGKETLTINSKGIVHVLFAVHRYSTGDMVASDARVEIQFGEEKSLVMNLPEARCGEWWHLARFEGNAKEIHVLDVVKGEPPVAFI